MYEHSGELEQVPFPYHLLPPDTLPMETIDAVPILAQLLEETAGLAGTLYAASLHHETAQHELSASLHVLAEQARATLAIYRRWDHDTHPGGMVKEAGA